MPSLETKMLWCWKNGISMYRKPVNNVGDCQIVLIRKGAHIPGKEFYRKTEVENKMIALYAAIYEKNNKAQTGTEQ